MSNRPQKLNIEEVLWQDDVALFRSMDGRVPWAERFGQGQVKVLHFDLETEAATYLFEWPASYDPLGEHGHGGDCTELVLSGSLVDGETALGPGTFLYVPTGQRHGPFKAGPEGCTLLVQVQGPLFDQQFIDALLEEGKAARHRA